MRGTAGPRLPRGARRACTVAAKLLGGGLGVSDAGFAAAQVGCVEDERCSASFPTGGEGVLLGLRRGQLPAERTCHDDAVGPGTIETEKEGFEPSMEEFTPITP